MMKLLLAVALLLSCLHGYQIYEAVVQNQVGDINWPFTICKQSDVWDINSLTLGGQPARNTNDDITVVTHSLSRPALPPTTSTWSGLTCR
jgi:hypothetical protein